MTGKPLSDEWCEDHFDYLAPEFARELHPTLARMRARCPISHSDAHGGYWIVTRYADVVRVSQDWESFSNQLGVGIPHSEYSVPAIPEHIDPPLHRVYKTLISRWLTPAIVRRYEAPTRALVTRLIDEFVDRGSCDFMTEFAQPFPALAFFEMVLGAPSEEIDTVAHWAQRLSVPSNPDAAQCWQHLGDWIAEFVARRAVEPPKDDIVNAILGAQVEGRPVTDVEVKGMILLLILGGLETTAGVLGQCMLRFCREPAIPERLRADPAAVDAAVEELLRLESSFICVGRTARHDADLAGHPVRAGDKVLVSWASANRDADEFPDPDVFDPERRPNRHLAFGAGPHRCVGSNLARMNLRIALPEVARRLPDPHLLVPEAAIPFHNAYNRSPLSLPLGFTAGRRAATP